MKAKMTVALVLALGGALGACAYLKRTDDKRLRLAGTVEARDVEVGSLVGGRVLAVHVEEGATVAAGQTLVTFEGDFVEIQTREQASRVAEAEAVLARLVAGPRREETAQARVAWEDAERERRRLEPLLAEGIVPRQSYDQTRARAEAAQQAYLQLSRGSRKEDLAAARAAVLREQERLAYLRRQGQEAVVKAPVDGVIQTLDLRPGDLVAANRPVATLLEPGQLWVRAYVPEPELGRVHLGQKAELTVDTFPDRVFSGSVVEIRARAEYTPRNVQTLSQRNEQVFGVKVAISPAPEIKPGMAALVRFFD